MKNNWDIIIGIISAIVISIMSRFEYKIIQLCYSIILLMLVSIGVLRVIKDSFEKNKKHRKKNVIDKIVDRQKPIKAYNIAQSPTKEGEKLGKKLIILMEVLKRIMNKIKVFFEKFKGYILTIALGILTAIEMYGDVINNLCGGVLVIEGVRVIPIVTLVLTIIVGLISNGFTREQAEKIKALFAKPTTNELVIAEIKKAIKDGGIRLTQFKKALGTKEHELEVINAEKESLINTYNAKKEMYYMIPQLASEVDVQNALNNVSECNNRLTEKENEINNLKTDITELETSIKALQSQLK